SSSGASSETAAPLAERPSSSRPLSDVDTRPIAMITDDIDIPLAPPKNLRRGSLGPSRDRVGPAGDSGGPAGDSEMPNLVEPANVAASTTTNAAATANAPEATTEPTKPTTSSSPQTPSPQPAPDPTASAKPASVRPHRILLSPSGTPLTQARVRELAKLDHLVLVCGRYEGIDQRVIDLAIDEELSIGDYVLSGGELGALVVIDAVARLIPGVLGEPTSADDESFSEGLLEYPQYTRPIEITMPSTLQSDRIASPVPAVLQSGNHAAINAWRRQQAMQRTAWRRPDLWRQFKTTKADDKLFAPLRARTHLALVHHPVVDRNGTVVTTALTNFDIHDLARSTMTYGLAGYHIVTPITSQRDKAEHIAKLWMEDAQGEHRAAALRLIRTAESIEAVIAALTEEHGQAPTVVATSAREESFPGAARRTSLELISEASLAPAPLLILLGTGWGLADTLIPSVSRVLAPIEGASPWNHLSVRSAGAVILDRLFGRPA
ncbi:MAG TPA: tRNA (guanosine(37)-N1)-methyltransferase TrmD, partial [Kofleriaceae bacterium]